MTRKSPAKVRCERINQVAIAVKDLELVVENFWNILGIGPWSLYDWEAPLVYDRTYYGKPAWARERIAIARVGDVELELMEVIDGPSIYRDWIEEHGEGLHHMNFLVDDFGAAMEALTHEGFECIQSARFGLPEKGCEYAYFDIPPLRTIWEPVYGNEPGVEPRMLFL